jgi:hypothetical protein
MARVFWMAFSYGFFSGLMFWINEKMFQGWARAVQPVA